MTVMTMTTVMMIACLAVGIALIWDWTHRKQLEDQRRPRADGRSHGAPALLGLTEDDRAAVLREVSPPEQGRESVFHHPCHTWVRRTGDGTVQVGVDELIVAFVGEVEKLEMPAPGTRLNRDMPSWSLFRRGRKLDLVAPVSGKVLSINSRIAENPALLGETPYDEGWCFTMEPANLTLEQSRLYPGVMAREWQELSRKRVRQLFAPSLSPVVQTALDGGELVDGFGDTLTDREWQLAQTELFSQH